MEIADRILALDGTDLEALAAKGAGLLGEGQFGEALGHVRKLIDLEPDNIGWRAALLEILG